MKEVIQKSSQWQRTYREKNPWAKHWMYAKSRSIHLSIPFTLKVVDVKLVWIRDNADQLKRPSIDRLLPHLGYGRANIRFIERSLNSSIAHKGKPSWNKGLVGIKTNKKGGIPWNKGKKQNGKSN